jgi:hypothetical protein
MSFLWRDYLTVAAALIQARNTFAPAEGRYRAAISRAYYAAVRRAIMHEIMKVIAPFPLGATMAWLPHTILQGQRGPITR